MYIYIFEQTKIILILTCVFQTVYSYPILNSVEYALRLDDDSSFLQPIRYDLFQFMAEHSLSYGFIHSNQDDPKCIFGLWETVQFYVDTWKINTTFFQKLPKRGMFYNNFELSKVSIWKSIGYQEYVNFIDNTKGIFFYRWGDAPIKTLGLSLFVPEHKIYKFRDIAYKHTWLETKPNSNEAPKTFSISTMQKQK